MGTTKSISSHLDEITEVNGNQLELSVRIVILQTMLALNNMGYTEIHLGGLLRIMGYPAEKAKQFDKRIITLDKDFSDYVNKHMAQATFQLEGKRLPRAVVLH